MIRYFFHNEMNRSVVGKSSVKLAFLCSSLWVSSAFAQGTTMSLSAGGKAQNVPASTGTADTADVNLDNRPTMIGQTAPTDEKMLVLGHHYSDGVTRRAIGGGLMVKEDAPKSKSTITRDYIEKQTPGLNPMQLIALLPGVNATDSDPMGLTGGHTSVRGMNENSMGYTLEGFPLNDIGSYAVYPQEIVDSENLSSIQVAQGSADLDSPTVSASGGVVNMYLIDPTEKMGGRADFSYGSYNAVRGFARFDTGLMGNSGTRAYFSFSDTHEEMWRGPGDESKLHGEMKVVKEWGKGNRMSLVVVGNQLNNYSQPSVSMASWNKYGIGVPGAIDGSPSGTPANTVYNSVMTGNPKIDQYYYKNRINPFTNIYISAPSHFNLGSHLSLTETPYFWYGYGNGGGAYSENMTRMSYGSQTMSGTINGQSAGNTNVVLYNPSITRTYRPGAVTKLTWTAGINRLMVGYWFEYSYQRQTSPYSALNADGTPVNEYGDGANLILANGQVAQYRDTLTRTIINTPFIGDSISLFHNRLTIDAGLKYSIITRDGRNYLPDTSTGTVINQTYREALPTMAFRYKVDSKNQLFFSVATNYRVPMNSSLYDSGAYYAGSGYSNHAATGLKPEVSISEEFGWRYQGKLINTSLTYFHYNFTNRLFTQTIVDPHNMGDYYTTSINGGGETTNGVDFEIGTRPIYNIRPYFSAEYIDARNDSNLAAQTRGVSALLPTKGKFAPQTPRYQFGLGLDYDNGGIFGNFSLKYVAKQYSTFMNDEAVPSYVRMNIGVGYRFKSWGLFKSPTIKLNLSNITNNHYLNYASGIETNAQTAIAMNGKSVKGYVPTYGIASPFSAIFSMSSGF
ncbi:TonB-dependent receptor [Komagataeibacter medellinensis]|uniref:TonB-dependent receptor n=1 Tax=Komagataeibacter medellinensis (strain NBRC 3288 / BCRC 11682 / LMG 1693 / Kondo 51) TaxID=634177 RepID=G2I325_KOMMN|nr:TonB-dependent receptor [Komagataeibacter medellinensis NBRC 3288]